MENTTLVALTPQEMPAAQRDLSAWLDQKIESVKHEIAEAEENIQIAVARKLRQSGFRNLASRMKRLLGFYEKIQTAIQAGYLIVPAMNCTVFAVRTDRKSNESSSLYRTREGANEVRPKALPTGEGEYVNPESHAFIDHTTTEKYSNGQEYKQNWWGGADHMDVAFPIAAIKPHVMDATGRAMALKVFDEIGVVLPAGQSVRSRRGDPFVIGLINDPRRFRPPQAFFIAWWFDTRSL